VGERAALGRIAQRASDALDDLARDAGRAKDGLGVATRLGGVEAADECGVGDDRRERVVEVVGDPRGGLAERCE
jgi:hypothetical protein